MTFNIHEPGTIFALLMAFYVCLHCALTIVEISRTEKAEQHIKMVRFTTANGEAANVGEMEN